MKENVSGCFFLNTVYVKRTATRRAKWLLRHHIIAQPSHLSRS